MASTPAEATVGSRLPAAAYLLTIATYLLLSVIALLPLAFVEIPALVDYPNHLARMHILAALDDYPALQENYRVDWAVVPNLAMDAIVPFLVKPLGLFAAGKLFVAISLLLPVVGVAALHHVVHGRPSLWPAAAFLFVYNSNFVWGLLNYMFAVGLFFLAFAGWIATHRWPRWRRLLVFTAVSTLLYLSHFFAFAVYALSVFGYEFWRWREDRKSGQVPTLLHVPVDWIWAMAQGVPAAILLLMAPGWDGDKLTYYGSLAIKIIVLLTPVLAYGDTVFLVLLVLPVVYFSFRNRWLVLAPALRFPLLFLAVVAVLMPHALASNWLTDYRLPTVLAMLLIAGTRFAPPDRWIAMGVAAFGAFIFIAQLVPIGERMQAFDDKYAEVRRALHKVEEGARILTVQAMHADTHPTNPGVVSSMYWHMVSLAVIDRSAFVPSLFTNRAAQPVRAAPGTAHLDVPYGRPVWPQHLPAAADPTRAAELPLQRRRGDVRVYWTDWPSHYDYVLSMHMGNPDNPMPALLKPVEIGSFFTLYKVQNARSLASGEAAPPPRALGADRISDGEPLEDRFGNGAYDRHDQPPERREVPRLGAFSRPAQASTSAGLR